MNVHGVLPRLPSADFAARVNLDAILSEVTRNFLLDPSLICLGDEDVVLPRLKASISIGFQPEYEELVAHLFFRAGTR